MGLAFPRATCGVQRVPDRPSLRAGTPVGLSGTPVRTVIGVERHSEGWRRGRPLPSIRNRVGLHSFCHSRAISGRTRTGLSYLRGVDCPRRDGTGGNEHETTGGMPDDHRFGEQNACRVARRPAPSNEPGVCDSKPGTDRPSAVDRSSRSGATSSLDLADTDCSLGRDHGQNTFSR